MHAQHSMQTRHTCMNSSARGSCPPFTMRSVWPMFPMRPRFLRQPPQPQQETRVQLQHTLSPLASAALFGNSKCLSHTARQTCTASDDIGTAVLCGSAQTMDVFSELLHNPSNAPCTGTTPAPNMTCCSFQRLIGNLNSKWLQPETEDSSKDDYAQHIVCKGCGSDPTDEQLNPVRQGKLSVPAAR